MTMRGRAAIAGSVAALLALGVQAGARPRQDREDPDERSNLARELKQYHTLLEKYRVGDDRSIDQLLEWDRKRLLKVIAAAQTPIDPFQHWPEARIKAAVMLHTDAALRLLPLGTDGFSFQNEVATRVLQFGGDGLRSFARSWYTAVSRSLRDRAQLFLAEAVLERARRNVPDDAGILYESGALQEQIATYSAFITVTVTEVPRSRIPGGPLQTSDSVTGPGVYRQEQRRALDAAARWLGQSLKAEPTSELAQLHFGRVQVLRGHDAEGARFLRPLADSAADPDISYLATMFLAAMQQRHGRLADAETLYRAAADKYPASQAPYVALSELLQTLGRADEARSVLLRLLATPAPRRTDAWWWYLAEPIGEASRRIQELRAAVRR
jgi:tetratricopeptide (TPR) repeat protein